jgi:hypothetical protein
MTTEASKVPLSVAVRGDSVVIHFEDGRELIMDTTAAERTIDRLRDAIALAGGRHPSAVSRQTA